MTSLIAKNVHGVPHHRRGATAHEKLRESQLDTQAWVDLERAAQSFYGTDTGRAFARVLRRAEFDFDLFCTKLIGIKPLPWQSKVWNEGLMHHPNVVGRLPNGVGKTVDYGLIYFKAGVYRHWAPEYWGTYSMRHLGPLEEHAMKTHTKMTEALDGRAREQAYRARRPDGKMGWLYRPNLLAPFIEARDVEKHPGFEFFGGSALLSFTGTAQGARSSDGTDPFVLGWDEVRHERNVTYVVGTIITPRYLRTPDGRFITLYTPDADGAAIELGEMYRRGQTGRKGWWSFAIGLKEGNPTIRKADYDRVERDSPKRVRGQILRGEEAQPQGALFPKKDIDAMFFGEEPDWMSELGSGVCPCGSCTVKDENATETYESVMRRITARCPVCQAKEGGDARAQAHEHPVASFADPASSAENADAIAFVLADLEPPDFSGMEVMYAERLEEGSSIDDIVAHANAMATLTQCPVGYDRKGALGHAMEDDLYDMPGEFVAVQNDTREQKSKRLDFLATLMAKRAIRMRECILVHAQLTHYRRHDLHIAQDFVMALAGLADIAKADLPERVFEREEDTDSRDPESDDVRLDGMGEADETEADDLYAIDDDELLEGVI